MNVDWLAIRGRFLTELERTGNVAAACRHAGISRSAIYVHRSADPAFAAEWTDALETATDALETEARRRALEGVERRVFWQGEEIDTIREYSDTLMIFLLKAHRPGKFRDNVNVRHEGDVMIRVEYVDDSPDGFTPEPAADESHADDHADG